MGKLKVHLGKLLEPQPSEAESTQERSCDFSLGVGGLVFSKTLPGKKEEEFPLVCTSDWFIGLLEETVK